MNTIQNISISKKLTLTILVATLVVGLSGCSSMSKRDKSTAIGAGVGAVTGAVLTGGSAWGTVGGAAVGGVIGNQVGKHK
jgi:osmotically inducible lipoprotein OsmB